MPWTSGPVTAGMTNRGRLEGGETHGQGLEAAISQLVNAMLELKRLQEAAVPVGWQELTRRVRDLEQQLATERACGDLTRVSRMHPKTRSVIFVGTFYFGDNVKYAWLGLRERCEAEGIACWFLPYHETQQAQVESLGGRFLPVNPDRWTAAGLHAVLSAGAALTTRSVTTSYPAIEHPRVELDFLGLDKKKKK